MRATDAILPKNSVVIALSALKTPALDALRMCDNAAGWIS